MKVYELSGAALDLWVAKALAQDDAVFAAKYERPVVFKGWCMVGHGMTAEEFFRTFDGAPDYVFREMTFAPSVRWPDGGPIIARERIMLVSEYGAPWAAMIGAQMESGEITESRVCQYGATPLIAAMRAKVASKFGEYVPDL